MSSSLADVVLPLPIIKDSLIDETHDVFRGLDFSCERLPYTTQESGGSNRGSQGFQADPSQDSQAAAVSLLVK